MDFSTEKTVLSSNRYPIYSNKSALPLRLDDDLLPCFAIAIFLQELAITAEVVLILKVFKKSPPVPQLSIIGRSDTGLIGIEEALIISITAFNSSMSSPFMANDIKKAETNTSEQ